MQHDTTRQYDGPNWPATFLLIVIGFFVPFWADVLIVIAMSFGAVQFYHTRAYREASPQLLVLVGLSVLLMLFHTFIY